MSRPPDASSPIRQPLWQGRHAVGGVWFPAETIAPPERARRILRQWRRGSAVFRFPHGDVLRFAAPVEMAVDALGGWPLCKDGTALSSAPLRPAERSVLPAADVVLVLGGVAVPLMFAEAMQLDPAQWLDLAGYVLHDTLDHRMPPGSPVLLAPEEVTDLRDVLGPAVPQASDAKRAFLESVSSSRSPGVTAVVAGRGRRRVPWTALLLFVAALGGVAALGAEAGHAAASAILSPAMVLGIIWLLARWRRAPSSWSSAPAAARAAPPAPSSIAARRMGKVGPKAWRQWLARLAVTSHLAGLLGRRQAAYMRRMLKMFDSGRLDEALRHAIPLGAGAPSGGQAFGTPGPRNDLSLTDGSPASASLNFGPDLEAHLRQLYRRRFERLDREGRIDEAVFVLAELLQARQEALDYLERHGRFEQAGRLALTWDSPPGTIVRLLCLAGDWRRALAVARRDQAFAQAVVQLTPKWPHAAAQLREDWAHHLAAQGRWLEAIEVLWPLTTKRELAVNWLQHAEAEGGDLGAKALVTRAALLPDTLERESDRIDALVNDPACCSERTALVEALLTTQARSTVLRDLARAIAPAVLADHAAGQGRFLQTRLRDLLRLADDALLNADLPPGRPLPECASQPLETNPQMFSWQAPEPGALPILDAVPAQGGRYLLACGEGGAVLIDASGRVTARFASPAHRIVYAPSGAVALLLAPRADVWRVSRLDLVRRTVTDLGMLHLACFADQFDGVAWTVSDGRSIRVLDTREGLNEALWQVSELGGVVRALTSTPELEQALIEGPQGLALWQYKMPQRRLLSRDTLSPAIGAGWLHPTMGWMSLSVNGEALVCDQGPGKWVCEDAAPSGKGAALPISGGGRWLIVARETAQGMAWQVLSATTGTRHGVVAWPASAASQARFVGDHLIVCDDAGRLWALDTRSTVSARLSVH